MIKRLNSQAIVPLFIVLCTAVGAGATAAPPTVASPPSWRSIGPGGGGWIPCVTVSPLNSSIVYVGCDVGGFFKSTDQGATWRICNTGLHDYYIACIAPDPHDPNVLYVGTQGGVHKSLDGGETWRWLREGFPPLERYRYSAPIASLAIDPQNTQNLYAGIGRTHERASGQGTVYRSQDAGAHWAIANPDGGGMDRAAIVSDLLVTPNGRRIYAATDRGLYRSDDSAATWRRLDRGLPHGPTRRVALCRTHPNVLYVSLWSEPGTQPWQGGVYRSDNAGEEWKPCLSGLETRVGKPGEPAEMTSNIERLVVHPINPDVAWAGDAAWVSAGLYRTETGGQSWTRVTGPPESPAMHFGWITFWGLSITAMAEDPQSPDTLFVGTSGDVFRTTDRGDHWQAVYTRRAAAPAGAPKSHGGWWSGTGLETTCLNSVVVHPRDPNHLLFGYFDIGLLQSLDGGKSFTQTVEGMHYTGNTFTVVFDPDNPRILYAGTGEWGSNHGDVCRSEDGGFTWRVVGKPETGLPDGRTRHLLIDRASPPSARRIYVSAEGAGLFCSEDGGAPWHLQHAVPAGCEVRYLAQDPRVPKTLYALLSGTLQQGGGLYISHDRFHSWQRVSEDAVWPEAEALALCPSDPRRLYVAARETFTNGRLYPGGVFASRDAGATWTRALDNPFVQTLAVDPHDAELLYAGGTDDPYHDDAVGTGVLRSSDGGRTWTSLDTQTLACRNVNALALDMRPPARLYAGTGGDGVFVRTINQQVKR